MIRGSWARRGGDKMEEKKKKRGEDGMKERGNKDGKGGMGMLAMRVGCQSSGGGG